MAAQPSILPLLREYAPRLTRPFFACRQCSHAHLHSSRREIATQPGIFRAKRQTAFLKAFRTQSTTAIAQEPATTLSKLGSRLGKSTETKFGGPQLDGFPKISSRAAGWWLIGSAATVYVMVVLGGLTRLTESGLSITEWRPVTGTLPPFSQQRWEEEFDKYKMSPEFKQLNPNIDLPEFKKIYWMEYAHRLLGRAIGLGVLLPTVYFIARKRVSLPIARNLLLINGLIGFQGFVGWWMVKSGLKDDLFASGSHPRVSQYRLAVHLGLAFTAYSSMLWNGLSILRERRLAMFAQPGRAEQMLSRLGSSTLAPFRKSAAAVGMLVSITVLSGALVAGLDAGLIYNEFPYMGLGLTPPKSELFSTFYSRQPESHSDLYWRNMFENPSLVQLDHRILATSTFVAVNALFLYGRFKPAVRAALPRGARQAMYAAMGLVWMQATLGISTLIYLVPTTLASLHQAGSLALLTSIIVLGNRVWVPSRLSALVKGRLAQVRAAQRAAAKAKGSAPTARVGMGPQFMT